MEPITMKYQDYLITTEHSAMQPEAIQKWLSEKSYWSPGISYEKVKTSVDHSYCIGIFKDGAQVGFARLVTDYVVFAYLADVYVLEEHRGQGLSKKMMEILFEQDWTKGLRRIMLGTRDAHGLYKQYGFTPMAAPDRFMEVSRTAAEAYGPTDRTDAE
jgi:GNAT superfamily N-acetyltransferase